MEFPRQVQAARAAEAGGQPAPAELTGSLGFSNQTATVGFTGTAASTTTGASFETAKPETPADYTDPQTGYT